MSGGALLTDGQLQIAIVADSDPRLPATNSGVALGLMRALSERDDVEVVAAVSSAPPRFVRLLVIVASWRPARLRWRLASRRGAVARHARSWTRSARLRAAGVAADVVVVHVRNVYRPSRWRYVSFIDTTIAASAAGWSEWDEAGAALTAFERRYYESASVVCVAAAGARDSVLTRYGQPAHKVVTVGGGANFTPDPSLVDRRRAESPAVPTILFVGKDFERKGGDLLVEAARSLRQEGLEFRLLIVGCRVDLDAPGVEVLGPIHARDELWDLYRGADIFCLPARWEPYGLVVQEAMAAGLPVVVSRTGELPSIVADAGIVVDGHGADAIAAALRPLLLNGDLRSSLGRAAVRRVSEALGWEQVASRMVASIRAVLPDDTAARAS